MSVKDRISKMNSIITEETDKAKDPERIKPQNSDVALRYRTGSTSSLKRGANRASDPSMKAPLQLPGMETEKGGEQ